MPITTDKTLISAINRKTQVPSIYVSSVLDTLGQALVEIFDTSPSPSSESDEDNQLPEVNIRGLGRFRCKSRRLQFISQQTLVVRKRDPDASSNTE